MDNRYLNNRFFNQISWPTVFVAAGFAIGIPYIARRYGLFQNISRPQDIVNKATDVARGVADRVGVGVSKEQSSSNVNDTSLTH